MRALLLTFLLFPFTAHAFAPWSKQDIYREAAYDGLTLIDTLQTHVIAASCRDNREPAVNTGTIHPRSLASGSGTINTSTYQGTWRITGPCYRELNPLLGNAPHNGRINEYMLGTALAHAAISAILPETWRARWQWLSISFEGAVVAHNLSIGVHIPF